MTPRCSHIVVPRASLTKPRPCARAGVVVRQGRLYCRQHGRVGDPVRVGVSGAEVEGVIAGIESSTIHVRVKG